MRYLFMLIFSFGVAAYHPVDAQSSLHSAAGNFFFKENENGCYSIRNMFGGSDSTISENPRMVAIALDLTLGLLGVHRLYLGTDLKVPILYTLTFGGGGILWLVDLGLLVITKDIGRYIDNSRVFMWTKK